MWNRGNEYNSPVAQMARLREAGLNPNLVYGSGATGNMASQLPKYNAPTVSYNYQPPVNPLEILGAYQDFRLRQAQLDNMEANRKATEAGTTLKGIMGELKKPELEFAYRNAMNKSDAIYLESVMRGQKSSKLADEVNIWPELMKTQLQAKQAGVKNLGAMFDRITTQTAKDNLESQMIKNKLDLFAWQFWGDLGIRAFNSLMGAGAGGKLLKGIGSFNKETRAREQWKKEFIRNYERY